MTNMIYEFMGEKLEFEFEFHWPKESTQLQGCPLELKEAAFFWDNWYTVLCSQNAPRHVRRAAERKRDAAMDAVVLASDDKFLAIRQMIWLSKFMAQDFGPLPQRRSWTVEIVTDGEMSGEDGAAELNRLKEQGRLSGLPAHARRTLQ